MMPGAESWDLNKIFSKHCSKKRLLNNNMVLNEDELVSNPINLANIEPVPSSDEDEVDGSIHNDTGLIQENNLDLNLNLLANNVVDNPIQNEEVRFQAEGSGLEINLLHDDNNTLEELGSSSSSNTDGEEGEEAFTTVLEENVPSLEVNQTDGTSSQDNIQRMKLRSSKSAKISTRGEKLNDTPIITSKLKKTFVCQGCKLTFKGISLHQRSCKAFKDLQQAMTQKLNVIPIMSTDSVVGNSISSGQITAQAGEECKQD